MSNNQNEAKLLKASIAEFIGPLLKHLELAKERVSRNSEMVEIIDQIRTKVVKTKDSLDRIQNWERELIGHIGKIGRQIDSLIDHNNKNPELNESTVWNELRDILDKLSQIPTEKASDFPQKAKKTEVTESSNRSYQDQIELSMELKDLETLDFHSSLCLYSLGIFPESTKLKKRFVIYWWTGLGLLPWLSWEKAVLRGHNIFSHLVNKGFLKPIHIREHNQVIDHCTIDPTIHKWLLSANEKNDLITYDKREDFILSIFGDWLNTKVLVNLDQRYLNSKDISTKHNLQVVQLGNWRYTETEVQNRVEETGSNHVMSNDHIEVDEIDFLKKLGEKATYLSLQGISGIEEVHPTIGKLEKLMILDLRACHNLDKLPQKPRSTLKQKIIRWKVPPQSWFRKLIGWELPQQSWFKKLTILDISECYLLDHMPKWICELSNLEVLKGFVVGSVANKNRSCQLDDLSKLKMLKKLTIRIAREHLGIEDFSGLKPLQTLLVLTIIWGDNKSNSTIPANYFPKNLEKLDIRCYQESEASEMLNPTELKNLKRLYIRGGKLTKIPCNEKWKVEILRLRFLKSLVPSDWNELRSSFENLRYVEYVECSRPKDFPNDGSSWRLQESLGEQNVVENELDSLSFSGEIDIDEERVDHPRKEENLTQEIAPIIKKGLFFGGDMIEKDMDPTGITRIVKISIYHQDGISGLTVYFERNGTTQCTDLWGSNRGSLTEINLKTNEYITSVKGHVDYSVIAGINFYVSSLVLETNLAVYGPYGRERGDSFEFLADLGGQIIGFHGYITWRVNALGVYVRQSTGSIIKKGSFWAGGLFMKDMDPTGITRIVKISIYHQDGIYGLTVYFERNGTTQCTDLWGTNEGTLTEINLKPDEYIKSVKCYQRSYYNSLRSLVLETNLAVYGPYGKEEGKSFEHTALHGQIIGFHALAGKYVRNVGVYVQTSLPTMKTTSMKINLKTDVYITYVEGYFNEGSMSLWVLKTNLAVYGPYNTKNGEFFELSTLDKQIIIGSHARQRTVPIISMGPFGVDDGQWNFMYLRDNIRIVKIGIRHGDLINALIVHFECNGIMLRPDRWGGNGGYRLSEIPLETNEYITSVKGYISNTENGPTVSSLELETNLRVYGPYGRQKGESFELIPALHDKIIGFYGCSSSEYLNAVGVYIRTCRTIKKGPFGGLGGLVKDIDLARITRIVKIMIRHSNVIDALTVYFERNGTTGCTNQWGGNGGNLSEIKLETNEYITYVKGYFNNNYDGHEVVTSLVLKTNLAVYGPYGTENGESFELSTLHEQIIGFHARHGEYVNAVGVYVQKTGPIILKRPFGGDNKTWNVMYPRDNIRIVKIDIHHGDLIDALIVHFECNGIPQIPDRWGGNGGNLSEIPFESNEYITSVKGYISDTKKGPIVSSLKLKTNLRVYGPYGRQKGESFELIPALHDKIIGFYGRSSSKYLNAVGVYIKDLKRKLVLCGGSGGFPKDMDLTGVTRIVNVSIRHSDAIDALFVCFDRNGTIEQTSHWGGKTGALDKIDLKPNEYITSVRGYVGYFGDLFIVRSLELITNLKNYGPYGKEEGTVPFELSARGGQIIGFHGRSGAYLDAIGVYICPGIKLDSSNSAVG